MGSFRKLALFGALALPLLPGAKALAADMPETPVIEAPVPYEYGSGWYLRGDVGYKWYKAPDAHFDEPFYGNMIDETLSNAALAGFGVGYKWNNYFRTDLTVDYEWPGNFHGRLPCPSPCTGSGVPEFSDEFADISAWTGLVNAYWDFGNWGAITPYVGGGIGAAYLTSSNVHFVNPNGSTGTWGGASEWNFAWSITAGASVQLAKNWLVDVNYRYLNLGDAQSAVTTAISGTQPIHYDNISAQEVRIGFRYLIN
jgi:opacity protein-like surface antigen